MKKLLILLAVLVGLGIAAVITLTFFLGSLVTGGVNQFGPRLTQTKVELAGARISPLSGTGTLTGLFVGNPEGWNSDKAFSLGEIHLDIEPRSLLGEHIVIREIRVTDPQFVYETRLVSSNIKELLANIEEFTGREETPTKDGKPVKFEVRSFVLSGGTITVGIGANAITVPMPPISMRDLGTAEGGITPDQLFAAVMRRVLASIGDATTDAIGKLGATAGATATEAISGGVRRLLGRDNNNTPPPTPAE